MAFWTVVFLMAAVACCALCVYGISNAARRSHERRERVQHG
jgi:hypothetical protein